jgi:uncharacterized protein (TIGR03083 family)
LSGRTFAPWVEPLAHVLDEDRRAVIEFARSAPAESWSQPSTLDGWTRRDILAHLAGGNDQLLQIVLRAVVSGSVIDPAELNPATDDANARGVEERRSWSIDELIAELERAGEEVQHLLSQLKSEHESLTQPGSQMTLGQFLELVRRERHDAEHLAQVQT